MGKFDNLEKYLGKEDQYSPSEINNALDNMADNDSVMNSIDDDIDPDALANIDELLKITGNDEVALAPATEADADISLSGSELEAIAVPDDSPADEAEGGFDLSDFSALNMDDDSEAAEELASLQGLDSSADSIADALVEDTSFEMPDATGLDGLGDAGMDFSEHDDSVEPELQAGEIDPDVLDELQNLDTAPPLISDIATRRYSDDFSESDEIASIESDLAALSSQDEDYEMESPEGTPFQMDDMDISDGTEAGEFGDLLSQLSPGEDLDTSGDDSLIPEIGEEMDELSDILSSVQAESPDMGEDDRGGLESFGEESALSDAGGFDLEGGDFEIPDFGAEETEDLKSEGGDSGGLEDFMSGLESDTDSGPGPDFGDFGLESSTESSSGQGSDSGLDMDFGLDLEDSASPGETDFGDFNLESGGGEELDLSAFGDVNESAFDTDTDFGDMDSGSDLGDFAVPDSEFSLPSDDTGDELDLDAFSDVDDASGFTPLMDAGPISGGRSVPKGKGLDMDEEKALRIRNRINQLSDASLRKLLRNAFLDPVASPDKVEQLMAMLLLNEDEQKIYDFIEQNIPSLLDTMTGEPDDVEIRPEVPQTRPRRVIYAEDAKKAQEFQKEFQTYARYAMAVLGSVVLLAFIIFRFVWAPRRAGFFYKRGLQSINVGSYDNAEAKFIEGENVGGFDPEWYNKFALAYMDKNEYKLATNKYYAVLEKKPLDRETIFNFGRFFRDVYPPKYEKAIALYSRLYKKDKEDYEVIDEIGQTFIEWGDYLSEPDEKLKQYNEASELYKDYAAKNPKHLASRFKLLLTALRVENDEQIESWYEELSALNEGAIHLEILTELAKYYINRRELEKAKPILLKLQDYIEQDLSRRNRGSLGLKKELAVSDAYYQYARYYTINVDFVNAITANSNAILWNNKNGLAYNLMGEIYYINENLTNFGSIAYTNRSSSRIAEEFFRQAIKYSPGYYKPYANLGHIYYYQRDFNLPEDRPFLTEATNNYYKAKELLPPGTRDFSLQYNLAWVNFKTGNYNGAEEEWSDLYKDDPFNPVLSYAMGNTYFEQAQYLLSRKDTRAAIKRMNIAKVQYDKAIEYYESIAKKVRYINPQLERHQEIYMQLARSYNNRGVINSMYSKMFRKQKADYEQKALLDFFKAKDTALKISTDPYGPAEYNIKYTYDVLVKGRAPSFDRDIPKRTTLKKLVEEFKFNLIQTI